MMSGLQLVIRPNVIILALSVIAMSLLLASIIGQTIRFSINDNPWIIKLFNVDNEANFPSFFSVLVILLNSVLLCLTGLISQARARQETPYWFILAAGFLFLAYDEGFQVHEQLGPPMRKLLGPGELGVFYFGWVIPGLIGVALLSLFFMKFLRRIPPTTCRYMLTAAALYFGGCIGMEMLAGAHTEAHGTDYTYAVLVTIEEGLEMAGMIMMAYAMLNHIASRYNNVAFAVRAQEQPRAVPAAKPHFS